MAEKIPKPVKAWAVVNVEHNKIDPYRICGVKPETSLRFKSIPILIVPITPKRRKKPNA